MKLSDLPYKTYQQQIKHQGVNVRIGSFNVSLTTKIDLVIENFYFLYSHFSLLSDDDFIDFRIQLKRPKNIRYFFRPQVEFYLDEYRPFKPLPLDQSMAFFEWGLNYAIAQQAHQYLIIHAAVLEKNGKVLVFPGIPGAGKSTLCSALSHHGWRLFSDEQALISPDGKTVTPVCRPICLKNESIDVIRQFCPSAQFGDLFLDTKKGDISHVKPPLESVLNLDQTAEIAAIIFPRFVKEDIETSLEPTEKGGAFIELINHSFNYNLLGLQGFKVATKVIEQHSVYRFRYHNLDEALTLFNQMAEEY